MVSFPTTRWSRILASDSRCDDRAGTWEGLVRDYQPAILGFFRRSVLARDAEDLTQEFLLRSLRDGWWARATPEAGSFRRFLFALLHRFLAQQRNRGHRRFEEAAAEPLELPSMDSPEQRFDLAFALCLTRSALDSLQQAYAEEGRGEVFDALQPWLSETPPPGELVRIATLRGIAPNTLAVQLKRLRGRFQKAVRDSLAALCADPADVENELVALRMALATGGADA
ncbi:RNA polymerase sigma factor [Tahibacter amnicola]|uniref:RNA polymerase sigma-70 factor (ECF subfamily) n=1 Tax=Tahibacter amnicola TaxID=2976241 RepID=A0ABY6BKH1_9GAMM|nr:hypothetical protein [Tahibacter amnicola]UXI70111.1 hypothetical protein N4264_10920 [Tahibacter amnicola]